MAYSDKGIPSKVVPGMGAIANSTHSAPAHTVDVAQPRAEQCEDDDLAGQSCELLGYVSGTLSCSIRCYFDVSRCEDCEIGGPVTACAHPFDRHNDARMIALAASGNELGVALVTGTSSEDGYSGETSVRFARLDETLVVKSSVGVPLDYASKLSLSSTPDGWLLLVETLNYEGSDTPPNGVVQTLLSFDGAGQLRGTVAFHGRRDGFLVPREGLDPLYVFATDRGGVPKTWGQVLSYSGEADVAPAVADSWFGSTSTHIPACAAVDDYGVSVFSRYRKGDGEAGYVSTLMLPRPGVTGGSAFRATAPGPCAVDAALALIYQAQSPEDGALTTFLNYPAWQVPDALLRDAGPVPAYRAAGFSGLGPRALVLRIMLGDSGPTDLEALDMRIVAQFEATTVAHGPRVPSYDIVRFGEDAIAGYIGEARGNTGLRRITLARMRPEDP